MAKAKKQKKAKSGKGGGKSKVKLVFLLLLCAAGVILVKYAFIFLLVAVLPSIVAHIVDKSPSRLVFQIVMACNLTGVLPQFGTLISSNASEASFYSLIGNPIVWITMYGAAAIGWIIVSFTPSIALFIVSAMNTVKITQLQMVQKRLVEEWGPEVKRKEGASS